jgi:hypothetical protein
MIKFTDKSEAEKRARNDEGSHLFAVGASVMHRVGGRSDSNVFKVTRQLPKGTTGFQYRIKGEKDAHERVVNESALEAGPRKPL